MFVRSILQFSMLMHCRFLGPKVDCQLNSLDICCHLILLSNFIELLNHLDSHSMSCFCLNKENGAFFKLNLYLTPLSRIKTIGKYIKTVCDVQLCLIDKSEPKDSI